MTAHQLRAGLGDVPDGRRWRIPTTAFPLVLLLLLMAPCADALPILNESFELGTFDGGVDATQSLTVGSTTISSWTVVGDTIAWIGAGNPWGLSAQDGDQFLDLTDFLAGSPFGGVSQSIATAVGETYLLSYYLGSYTARWGGPPVSILASAGATSATCTDASSSTMSTWSLCTMLFTATSANTTITLLGTAGSHYIGLDNVSVSQVNGAVPEPATLLLFGTGLVAAGVLGYRRRNR